MKRWVSLLLPLVGLIIFVWIIRGVGVERIVDIFRGVEPKKLLVFPAFTAFFLWVRGLRWQLLMRIVGIEYPLWRTSLIWSIGFFAGSVTPGKVGDTLRAYYLSRETGRGLGQCLATMFVDRLMDLVTILVTGVVTILLFSYYYIHLPSVWVIVVGVIALMCLLYLLLHKELMKRFLGPMFKSIAPKRFHDDLSGHFHSFYDALRVYAVSWPKTLVAYSLTLLFWTGVVLLAYTITRVLGLEVPLRYLLLMMPVMTMVEALPISISGLGTRDAAVIYFFSIIGIGSAQAVGFALTYMAVGTYLTALVGFMAWVLRPMWLEARVTK